MKKLEAVFSAVGLVHMVDQWIGANMSWMCSWAGGAVVTDGDVAANSLMRVVRIETPDRYDIGRCNNRGIRTSDAEIIVKCDVDIAISHDAVDYILETVRPGHGLVQYCMDTRLWHIPGVAREGYEADWDPENVRDTGYGACFAMHREDWHRLRGYNEHMAGYAADDDDLYERAKSLIAMEVSWEHPVWHVAHPPRTAEDSSWYPYRRDQNLEIMADETWHLTPDSERWGR
jgi:hypothetical protein